MKKIIFSLTLLLVTVAGYSQTTYSKDAWGNTVQKDQYGNQQGTYSKDAWGNTIYTPKR